MGCIPLLLPPFWWGRTTGANGASLTFTTISYLRWWYCAQQCQVVKLSGHGGPARSQGQKEECRGLSPCLVFGVSNGVACPCYGAMAAWTWLDVLFFFCLFPLWEKSVFAVTILASKKTSLLLAFLPFRLLYGALGWSVINFSPLALWFKLFLYCLCFARGCGIIDLRGLELWAEVLPCLIYQLLLLKQPGCTHLIPSLSTVAFPEVLLFIFLWSPGLNSIVP